jgi:hypothetical protein
MAEATLGLVVTVPPHPGEYLLELDMVQELVAWFKDRDSPAVRLPMRVTSPAWNRQQAWPAGVGPPHLAQDVVTRLKQLGSRAARLPLRVKSRHTASEHQAMGQASGLLIPQMEMYSVPVNVVVGWVNSAGAELVGTQASPAAGLDWPSLLYCIRKPHASSSQVR